MGWIIAAAILLFLLLMPPVLHVRADGRTRVTLRYLFLKLQLFDSQAKPKAKKPKKGKKPSDKPEEKKNEKKEKKRSLSETLGLLSDVAGSGKAGMKILLRHLHFYGIRVRYTVAREDPCETGTAYGKISAAVYPLCGFLSSFLHMKFKRIEVYPDFTTDHDSYDLSLKVRISPLFVLQAGIVFLFTLLVRMMRRSTADKPIINQEISTKKGVQIHG